MDKKRWDLIALASIPLMMTLGNSMLIPVLPLMEREIEITAFQSSLIISIYSIVAIILIPISGYLSDKIGRKKVIIPSLLIVGIGGAVSAYAAWQMDNPYIVIMIGRFLQGIGAAGAFPVVLPTVGDMFKEEKQVSQGLGIIETANTLGKVLSPILGALLAVIIWYMPFIAIPILSMVSVLLVWFLVKTPKRDGQEGVPSFRQFIKGVKETFHHNGRWLVAVFFIGGILMLVLFGFLFHFSSLLEDTFHINGYMKGLVLAIPLLFLCIASFLSGKMIGEDKNRMRWFILIGNATAAISLFFVRDDMNLLLFTTLLSAAGIGIGASLPCLDALITEGIKKEERGSITSIYSSMRFVGVAAGPPVAALLMKYNANYIYYLLAGLSAVAVIITFAAIRPSSEKEESKEPVVT
ncbi:MFS transporter, ACDE family, multidrug resistance protein [Alteribacillus persepolensis]|uniref:MFS transporter, ACDE family, multidrug resistance protein n=1 Tax=Alteribacillus persepolensis TaxID=568899 RepID=A0A1G8DTX2_9BACI|nr:MFS transporter [Alteribacillus persepolensis]SDH61065.1 MFS transporter, ACDE family, multidrug resistance protein [Alteribacillus persepolensis]